MVYVVYGRPSTTSPVYIMGVFEDEDYARQLARDLVDPRGLGAWASADVSSRTLITQDDTDGAR